MTHFPITIVIPYSQQPMTILGLTPQQWADHLEFSKLIDQGFDYGQAKKMQALRKARP